ncbi:hypothetical protein SAMN02799630_01393 [Paenibacillus sp. UNCCL117]|nr:hypothetical protein SAMN04488602_103371 [Paenibacillus sp. cl123]SFW25431.1 hypothetical protein SAMN02799630_01393 [Paenibacillus sp. UNCCL117]
MIFIFIVASVIGYYLLIGILSLFGVMYQVNSSETVILLVLILIGIALNINYKLGLLHEEIKGSKKNK